MNDENTMPPRPTGPPMPPQPARPQRQPLPPTASQRAESRAARKAAEAKRAAARRRKFGGAALAALVVLGVAGAGVAWVAGREGLAALAGGGEATGAACESRTPVTLWVSPAMVPAATELTKQYVSKDTTPCYDFKVVRKSPIEAVLGLGKDQPNRPDGWIADSPRWVDQVNRVSGIHATQTKAFARSPLVIAMDPKRAAELSEEPKWLELIASDRPVRLPDPTSTTAGMLTISAALPQLSGEQGRAVIQKLAKSTATSTDDLFTLWTTTPSKASAFPASEADLFQFNKANPEKKLVSVTPAEGTPAFEHSLISVATDPVRSRAVRDLNVFLASPEAHETLVANGMRPPSGPVTMPTPEGSVGAVRIGVTPSLTEVAQASSVWQTATVSFRLLTVFDVSGSMKEKVANTTRVAITQDAAGIALAALPPTTDLGVWVFSTGIGPGGQDYREVVPIDTLSKVDHKTKIAGAAASLDENLGGSTGLYDTIWAAYQEVQKNHAGGKVNAVVILTDGKNEDPAGISLEQLLGNIKGAYDPKRPVAVTTIGIGPDVDEAALTKISQLTQSDFYSAPAPGDITTVLARALFDHECVNGVCV